MNNKEYVARLSGVGTVVFDPSYQNDDGYITFYDTMRKIFLSIKEEYLKDKLDILSSANESELILQDYLNLPIIEHLRGLSRKFTPVGLYDDPKIQKIEVEKRIWFIEGRSFVWHEGWIEIPRCNIPPKRIIDLLNKDAVPDLILEDRIIRSTIILLRKARIARENFQYHRATKIAEKILSNENENLHALAVLCANLRAVGKPKEAIDRTRINPSRMSHILLTTRAAAYCDLKEWDNAKKEISRALALEESDEAFLVVQRIKSKRPDLFPEK